MREGREEQNREGRKMKCRKEAREGGRHRERKTGTKEGMEEQKDRGENG